MTRSDIEDGDPPPPPTKDSRPRSPSVESNPAHDELPSYRDTSRRYDSNRHGAAERNDRRNYESHNSRTIGRDDRRSCSSSPRRNSGFKRSPSHSDSEQPNHKRYKHSGHYYRRRSRSPSSSSRVYSTEERPRERDERPRERDERPRERDERSHDEHLRDERSHDEHLRDERSRHERSGEDDRYAKPVGSHSSERVHEEADYGPERDSVNGRTPSHRDYDERDRRSLSPRDSGGYRSGRGNVSRSRSASPAHRRHDDYRGGRSRYGSPGRRRDYYHTRPWHGRGYYGRSGGSRHGRDWNDRKDDSRRDWYRDRKDDKDDEPPMTEEERKKKELDDARRDDLTVLVVNLSLKAQEKDIWQFFTKHAGKVRTIKLIKDSRSGKSKGIGYVEFQDAESVLKSLNLTGQCILNQPIRVQASQAEKNRAAKAAKQQQEQLAAQGPTKIYIGGLVDELSGMTQDELCQLFSPFGPILQIDVPKDPYTHRNRGYAFVQYLEAAHARDAMMAMHGFDIGGKQIRVGFAGQDQGKVTATASLDGTGGVDLDRIADDHDDRILHGGSAMRIALSQKLAQKVNDQSFNGLMSGSTAAAAPAVSQIQTPPPTEVVTLDGMFSKQEVEDDGLDILDEVCEDVKKECLKFGVVIDLFIDHENIDGKVHVRFADSTQAAAAVKNLNGRFFGGTAIKASYTDPVEYATMRQQALL